MTRLRFVAPAETGWGEVTLALRVARRLREAGFSCSFCAHDQLIPVIQSQKFETTLFPSTSGPALLDTLRGEVDGYDGWVLVDLFSGGRCLVQRELHPGQYMDLGPPLIAIDTWDSRRLNNGMDVFADARRPVDGAWDRLTRRLVPVPFAPLDTADGCALFPEPLESAPTPDEIRQQLGVGSEPLLLLCTSWWQHGLMRDGPTPDVVSLITLYLQRLKGPWRLLHIGPEDLPFAQGLPGRYRRLSGMPAQQFKATVRAADLVLSLNGSATTNTSAIALDTPVLCFVQRARAQNPMELHFQFGAPPTKPVVDWLHRHNPLGQFMMWPMCMVDALTPLLHDTPYGGLLNLTEILDERQVQHQLQTLLFDADVRADQQAQRELYRAQVAQIPGAYERIQEHLSR